MKRKIALILTLRAFVGAFALVCLTGCNSPEKQAGTANRETHVQTQRVATLVTAAQEHNAAADRAVVAAINDPATPAPVREQLKAAHAERLAVEAALKPINPDLLPRINDAADKSLAAELRAQNEQNRKVYYGVAAVIFIGVALAAKQMGFGIGVSVCAGGLAAILLSVVVGVLSKLIDAWLPYAIGAGLIGFVVYAYEAHVKGKGWLGGLHDWFDAAKADARAMPAQLSELAARVEAIAARVEPSPTPAADEGAAATSVKVPT